MSNEEKSYHKAAATINDAIESKLFGKTCYKIGKKAFCCFFQNCMVFKLPETSHADALSLDGAKLFDPSGKDRPMKEWVQVPFDYVDLWKGFAKSAAEYVGG